MFKHFNFIFLLLLSVISCSLYAANTFEVICYIEGGMLLKDFCCTDKESRQPNLELQQDDHIFSLQKITKFTVVDKNNHTYLVKVNNAASYIIVSNTDKQIINITQRDKDHNIISAIDYKSRYPINWTAEPLNMTIEEIKAIKDFKVFVPDSGSCCDTAYLGKK